MHSSLLKVFLWFDFQDDHACKSTESVLNKTFIKEQEIIQKQRRQMLNQACMKYVTTTQKKSNAHLSSLGSYLPDPPPLPSTGLAMFLQMEQYRHIGVGSKVKSTEAEDWNNVLHILSHFTNCTTAAKSSDLEMQRREAKISRLIIDDQPRHVTTFMFSRHPFVRLLSAYIGNIGPAAKQQQLKQGNYDELRKKILCRKSVSNNCSIANKTKGIPDFRDFVLYILDNDYFDDVRWKENYRLLSPCQVPYDIIGKFETFSTDAKFLLHSIGAQCAVDFSLFGQSAFINEKLLFEYYKTLSKDTMQRLYDRYKLDFLLFNYNFEITIGCEFLQFPTLRLFIKTSKM